jgi:transglutaminase-like putative cysteine protease
MDRFRTHVDRLKLVPLVALLAAVLLAPLTIAEQQAATAPAVAESQVWKQVWEHWYELELAGARAGWMRETVTTDGTQYRTESESSLGISRGAVELQITMASAFVETIDGKPIRITFIQDMSSQKVEKQMTFEDDHVVVVTRQGGRKLTSEVAPPEGPWLTPMAVHRYWMERFEAGAETIRFRTLTPETGLDVVEQTYERVGTEPYEFNGRTIPVTVWKSTTSVMPGVTTTAKISSDGQLVYDEAALPFGRVVTRITTKAKALGEREGPAPELMMSLFVPVDRPIERPRDTVTSRLRLRIKDGKLPKLPSAGAQRVRPGEDERSVILEIDINDNVKASEADRDDASYLEPSSMIDSSDPVIVKLAEKATRGVSDDPFARAEAMRQAVFDRISNPGLDTAFATASETARMRKGDCSEHGVLLCAMLRANGIPARLATGLVYADTFAGESDIFGWHMWTQALIDGRWVDFDATLDRRYDAAHILTGVTSFAEDANMADLNAMMMLIGNIEVDVLEVGYGE